MKPAGLHTQGDGFVGLAVVVGAVAAVAAIAAVTQFLVALFWWLLAAAVVLTAAVVAVAILVRCRYARAYAEMAARRGPGEGTGARRVSVERRTAPRCCARRRT